MPPSAGHGSLVYIEMDPVGSPGTFTVVPGLNYDINLGSTRPETNITPQNRIDSDEWVRGTMIRDNFPMTLNFDPLDPVHIELFSKYMTDETFGMRIIGPGGAAPEIIWSGGLTSWQWQNPVREGQRSVNCSFRASGDWQIDNEIYT